MPRNAVNSSVVLLLTFIEVEQPEFFMFHKTGNPPVSVALWLAYLSVASGSKRTPSLCYIVSTGI
jgi:hypothetical protein